MSSRKPGIGFAIGIGCIALAAAGCGKSDTSGSGTFPDLSAVAAKVVPQIPSSSAAVATLSSLTYDTGSTGSSHWTSDQPWLNEILGPDDGGVDTKIMIQLDHLKSVINNVNSQYSDKDGNATNCTKTLTSSDTVKTPFFSSATNPIFWTTGSSAVTSDSGKYTCFVAGTNDGLVFGRAAIANPPSGCSDAHEYYLIHGANCTMTGSGTCYEVQKAYYNGCTTQVAIAMSLSTLYDSSKTSDGEFDARFELRGTASSNTFQLRVGKIDTTGAAGTNPVNFNHYEGAGVAAVSSGSAHLIMGFTNQSCTDRSGTCSAGSLGSSNFCLTLTPGTTTPSYAVDSTTTDCASYETSFGALTPLAETDLSQSNVDFSTPGTPFGL